MERFTKGTMKVYTAMNVKPIILKEMLLKKTAQSIKNLLR